MEHYSDVEDIKRSLVTMCSNQQMMNPEFVLSFFGSMSPEVRWKRRNILAYVKYAPLKNCFQRFIHRYPLNVLKNFWDAICEVPSR